MRLVLTPLSNLVAGMVLVFLPDTRRFISRHAMPFDSIIEQGAVLVNSLEMRIFPSYLPFIGQGWYLQYLYHSTIRNNFLHHCHSSSLREKRMKLRSLIGSARPRSSTDMWRKNDVLQLG